MKTAVIEQTEIEINPEFSRAYDLIENSPQSIFITGRAGTGKSTFLQYFRKNTTKEIVVLAPTGVAAVNIKGQTIHSFFHFKPDITIDGVPKIRIPSHKDSMYDRLDTIIIDEISMVRADILDCVDAFLRRHGPHLDQPFGGVQMIFIGDLYQLSPVVKPNEQNIFQTVYATPYFFSSRVFKKLDLAFMEFETTYRQKDDNFLKILNHIRTNTVKQKEIDDLNDRFEPEFEPSADSFFIYLTTTNHLADKINYDRLHHLGEELFTSEGRISGDVDLRTLPTHQVLELKLGAQVILLNNDSNKRWINGSIGKIVDIFINESRDTAVQVELSNGCRVEVEPFTWEIFQFSYNEETDSIESDVIGSFRQLPLKLAWAVTIHKSQGKTFEKVIINTGRGTFCHGQLYVALSRCTTLEGIILKSSIRQSDILMDARISQFLTAIQYQTAEKQLPLEERQRILKEAIEKNQTLEIIYLKENNQRNSRTITPRLIRTIEYAGEKCLGVEAYCHQRQANWIFRLHCIVDINPEGPLSLR